MKRIFTFLLVFVTAVSFAVAQDVKKDETAIIKLIQKSYLQAIYINKDADSFVKGFHPEFRMLYVHDDHLHALTQADWAASIRAKKAKNPKPVKNIYSVKVPLIDITGCAAMIKVEVYKEKTKIYTDYMSLYKLGKDWKIVNKIYASHK